MAEDLVIREDRGPVTHLTLNLPGKLNALSDAMIAAVTAQFSDLMASETQRVIVLKGAGKAFCAGHDLKEMQAKRGGKDTGAHAFRDLFDRCARMMQMIPRLPQPVIAEVHGIATAAGCQLVASCDLAVAAEDCRFGVNGVNIGLFCSTPMVALSRNAPRKQVFEMLVTGEFITAARAREIGLVNRVVAPDALAAETEALAKLIAGKLGTAVRIGKRAFYEQLQLPLDKAYEMTGAVMVENMLNRDTNEGIAAFLDKRTPDWSQD
ncbi:enoyl-CoA hydratase [Roseicyclus persicicus]|uniref:Enoyl-CoA hydratase domain-containing protein 3, mitochondrial n=1 Tax=Roseicyclus persicicus TaxID=2650661 RepID=A0A7X6JY42_9RHOB|nr:enoyl-CoA hydratase [Roseibacterium persicicum]NKX46242.1 enoyl-CoA hydratase [Roseibacterium persicicum]